MFVPFMIGSFLFDTRLPADTVRSVVQSVCQLFGQQLRA